LVLVGGGGGVTSKLLSNLYMGALKQASKQCTVSPKEGTFLKEGTTLKEVIV
jgi:hypothetical protein